MQDAMGFLLMFDVTSDQSLVSCRDWLEQLTTHAYTDSPDIVLCGTKVCPPPYCTAWKLSIARQVDLEEERTVSCERAQELAAELGLPYYETSASTGQGNVDCTVYREAASGSKVWRRRWRRCWGW